MKLAEGWWVPDADTESFPVVLQHAAELGLVLRHMSGRRGMCVQAGGFIGVYPEYLAGWFERVLTFEPHPENHACLLRNRSSANVAVECSALWNESGHVGVSPAGPGMGLVHVVRGGRAVRARRLDEFRLSGCDLIQLDVEGSELRALIGATETVRVHRPVVVIEESDKAAQVGDSPHAAREWLELRGYRAVDRIHKDTVFLPC